MFWHAQQRCAVQRPRILKLPRPLNSNPPHPIGVFVASHFHTTRKGHPLKLSSLVALVVGIMAACAAPIAGQANALSQDSNLPAAHQNSLPKNRWLNQFGANAHVEPLCNDGPESTLQLLSASTCATLSSFHSEPAKPAAISFRISQIKRNRTAWNAIPRRDQRILEQYDVIVVGEARAVDVKIGPIR